MTLQAATIAAYTVEHGGGTFAMPEGRPVEPSNGYAVGLAAGTAATLPADATLDQLADAAQRVAEEWGSRFVGTWVMSDGRIAVDPVRVLTDRETALRVGREHGQQAIYGFAEREAIEC